MVNIAAGGTQVALTELANSKPDGYTLGYTPLPGVATILLDPARKAAFTREDFQTVALHIINPEAVAVKADSPYQTIQDLVEDAKANPGKIKISTAAPMGDGHLGVLQFMQSAEIDIGVVNFEGGAQAKTAVLGGHVDACIQSLPNFVPQVKSGDMRLLGIMDKEQSKFAPGVKTLEEQGVKANMASIQGISVQGKTPKEIVDVLGAAIKKAIDSEEHKAKLDEMSVTYRYLDADEYAAYWDEVAGQMPALMELAKELEKKK